MRTFVATNVPHPMQNPISICITLVLFHHWKHSLGKPYQFLRFDLGAGEAVNHAPFGARCDSTVFAKAFIAKDPNEVRMRRSRVQE